MEFFLDCGVQIVDWKVENDLNATLDKMASCIKWAVKDIFWQVQE